MGADAGMRVGLADVWKRRSGRAPGGAAVGAGERVRVGRDDLCRRRSGRAPGGAAVGAGAHGTRSSVCPRQLNVGTMNWHIG